MVDDTARQHQIALGQLREAEEYAKWSKKDREERLPPLTPEQREQMREFLKIVDQYGLKKDFEDTESELTAVLHGKKAASSD
jgi:transposase